MRHECVQATIALAVAALLSIQSCFAEEPEATDGTSENLYGSPLPSGAVLRIGGRAPSNQKLLGPSVMSPDGCRLACVGRDQVLRVFDLSTGNVLVRLLGSSNLVWREVQVSWDGRILATLENERTIVLWDIEHGRRLREIEGATSIGALALSPDGSVVAWGGLSRSIRFWTVKSGERLADMDAGCTSVLCLAFSPDGLNLIAGTEDKSVKLYDVASRKLLRSLESDKWRIESVAFSRDGSRFVAGGNSSAAVFDRASDWKRTPLDVHSMCLHVSISGDGALVATSPFEAHVKDGERFWLWDGPSGSGLTLDSPPDGGIPFLTPDGSRVLVLGDGRVRSWDTASGREVSAERGHGGPVFGVAWSDDGQTLVSAGEDRTIRKWDPATGAEISSKPTDCGRPRCTGFRAAALAAGGRMLLNDGEACWVWDMDDGTKLGSFSGLEGSVTCSALSPDGQHLAEAGTGPIVVRSVATGEVEKTLEEKPSEGDEEFGGSCRVVSQGCAAWSPDGKRLFQADWLGQERVWDCDSGDSFPVSGHYGARTASFSPDGKRLLCAGRCRGAVVLDAESGKDVVSIPSDRSEVISAAWAPDGRRLAFGDEDGHLRIADAETGRILRSYDAPDGVRALAWSPRGDRIATGLENGSIIVWDASTSPSLEKAEVDLNEAWERLRSPKMDIAIESWGAFIRAGETGRRRLAEGLGSEAADPRIAEWIQELDADDARQRDEAQAHLMAQGILAEEALRAIPAGSLAPESAARVKLLLERVSAPIVEEPVSLRRLRAIQAMERIGGSRAWETLQQLTKGSRFPTERRWAAEASDRLFRRPR